MDVEAEPVRRSTVVGVVAAIGCYLSFGLLLLAIDHNGAIVSADREVLRWVDEHRTGWMTALMRTVTTLGDVRLVMLVGALAVVLLVTAKHRALAVALIVSSAGTWLLVNTTKRLVQRPRPPEAFRLAEARGWSFPSGHAGQAAAMYLAIAVIGWLVLRDPRRRWAVVVTFGILAVAVGSSRVYLGVHWMSDVLAGWALGLAIFLTVLGVTASWTNGPSLRSIT